jgi:type III pantothenate kinase
MIIAVDIGNTNIKIGLFHENKLAHSFKMSSDTKRTSDEYVALLMQLLEFHRVAAAAVDGAIISSVIPQMDYTFVHVIEYCFHVTPLIVGVGTKTGLSIKYDFPRELGSDRIITCVAAMHKYGVPFVLVDFGTATTYNVVNSRREFIGGAITIGLKATSDALAQATSKLPHVELDTPKCVTQQSTTKAIQSGIIFGAVGQVKYIVDRIKQETGEPNMQIIATGGLSNLVYKVDPVFNHIDRELSLYGLYQIYVLNR